MPKYQVALIERPAGWVPPTPDAAPPHPGRPVAILGQSDALFPAVRQAIEHNQQAAPGGRWAVVVEPGSFGRTWPAARLCTPISYKLTAVWWPEGWEPATPLDVPNCVLRTQSAADGESLSYAQAVERMAALNRQCMDLAGMTWYVVLAVENEPLSRTVSYDPAGIETTVEVRQTHVITPERGGHGDCSHCPAHSFQCAQREWEGVTATLATTGQRSLAES